MSIKYNGGYLPTVGADGSTLVANSSASTGVSWAGPTVTAGKNALINGNFDIWQRSTSSTANGYVSADRWYMYNSAGTTTFAQSTSVVPTTSRYSLSVSQASATTGVTISQAIETLNAIQFAGQNATISVLASGTSGITANVIVNYSTSTDVGNTGSWTSITATSGGTGTTGTSGAFNRITGVYAIPSTAKSLQVVLYIPSLAAASTVYFAQAQLELGSVATAFSRAGGTLQGELAACQRYYVRTTASNAYSVLGGSGYYTSTTNFSGTNQNPVTMRVLPTSVDFSNIAAQDSGGGVYSISVVTIDNNQSTPQFVTGNYTTAASVATRFARLIANNNAAAYLGFSAEL